MDIRIILRTCLVLLCCLRYGIAEDVIILKELELMKEQIEYIIQDNQNLKQELKVISRTNIKLEQKLEVIAKENAALKRRTLILEHKVNNESRSNIESGLPVDYRRNNYNGAEGVNNQRKEMRRSVSTTTTPISGTVVAFSASVKSILTNLIDNQHIPFGNVGTNIGQAYHEGTGVFTCPQSGVYAFFLTILTHPTTHVEAEILKDGVWLAAVYSSGGSGQQFGSGSTSVTVRLQKGDNVWVQVSGDGHSGSGNMIFQGYSSFTGFSLLLE